MRAFVYKYKSDIMDDLKSNVRSRSRYLLRTDINQFYHSIYAHSIAWALHGKTTAKAQRNNRTLLGDVLDKQIRHSQDNQTIGIPIGPDISFLIAGVILSVCDIRLREQKVSNFTRYIDDYEFGCEYLQTAELYRDKLQELLSEYELVLNPDKTEIIELPITMDIPCISTIRTVDIRDNRPRSQRYALIHIFDIVFENTKQTPEAPLLKYLLGKLRKIIIDRANWTLYENVLLQCVISDPSTITYVLNELWEYQCMNYPLKLNHIKDVMTSLIKAHAPINHCSEVAWAIWTQIVLGIPISQEAVNATSKMSDSVVGILLLDAYSKHLIRYPINFNNYQLMMNKDELYGDQWLLSYEANIKNWLPSTGSTDHVSSDTCFGHLKTASVSFYDDKWSIKNEPRTTTKRSFPPPGGGGWWWWWRDILDSLG